MNRPDLNIAQQLAEMASTLQRQRTGHAPKSVTVLEAGHLTMAEPSLGCFGPGGEFYFVGNAAWARFEGRGGEPSAPRPVPIFKTK